MLIFYGSSVYTSVEILCDVRSLIFTYVIVEAFVVTYQVIGWSSKYLIWKHLSYCFPRCAALMLILYGSSVLTHFSYYISLIGILRCSKGPLCGSLSSFV